MGMAKVALDTRKISSQIGRAIRMEILAGMISLQTTYAEGELGSFAIQTSPAFVHTHAVELDLGTSRAYTGEHRLLRSLLRLGRRHDPLRAGTGARICPENAWDLVDLGVYHRILQVRGVPLLGRLSS